MNIGLLAALKAIFSSITTIATGVDHFAQSFNHVGQMAEGMTSDALRTQKHEADQAFKLLQASASTPKAD